MSKPTPARRSSARGRHTWSDSRLVDACLAGDAEAWSALLDRYGGLIYTVASRVGLTGEDASDVVQTVSITMLDHLGDLRCVERLSSWLITTTRREALRALRRVQRRGAHGPDVRVDDLGDDMATSSGDDMADGLIAIEDQQIVRKAMACLPDRCRQLLTLLFCSDPPASYAEVAAKLGIPVGSVGPTRARCLERLRKTLDEMGF